MEGTYSYGIFPYASAKKVASQVLWTKSRGQPLVISIDIVNRGGAKNIPYCLKMVWRLSYSACDMATMGVGGRPLFSADVLFFGGGSALGTRTKQIRRRADCNVRTRPYIDSN